MTWTWPKAILFVGGCAVGGFVGGIGLARLVSEVIVRRAVERLTT